MRALILRFRRSIGVLGVSSIVVFAMVGMAFAAGVLPTQPNHAGVILEGILFLTAIVVAAAKYRRSSATWDHEDIRIKLARSERKYCVVLRTFGRDGEIIVPRRGQHRLFGWVGTWTVTMEQIVAKAARWGLDLDTYAIVDQSVSFAPPGPTFVRAPEGNWRVAAEDLISRAHAIVLILIPGREMGEGLEWEIEQIVRYGMQSRVVIVLPPYDQDVHAHLEARKQAEVLLALLDVSATRSGFCGTSMHGYEPLLPTNTLVVKSGMEKSDARTWGAGLDGPPSVGDMQKETIRRMIDWLRGEPPAHVRSHRGRGVTGVKTLTDASYVFGLVGAFDEIDMESVRDFDGISVPYERDADSSCLATLVAEARRGEEQRLDADRQQAVCVNRSIWGPEADIRAELMDLNRRIRDRERVSRTNHPRLLLLLVWAASAIAVFVVGRWGWFLPAAVWVGEAAGFGSLLLRLGAIRTASASLPSLYTEQRELQDRLACGLPAQRPAED